MPVNKSELVNNEKELLVLAPSFSYPMVMKTAMEGARHKSDLNGVILDIQDEKALLDAYADLSSRLGNKALIASMINTPGIEMIMGIARDEQFGPMIIIGFGGIYTELMNDVVLVTPPFDAQYALHQLDKLKMRRILDGVRGKPALDIASFCEAAAILSVLAHF